MVTCMHQLQCLYIINFSELRGLCESKRANKEHYHHYHQSRVWHTILYLYYWQWLKRTRQRGACYVRLSQQSTSIVNKHNNVLRGPVCAPHVAQRFPISPARVVVDRHGLRSLPVHGAGRCCYKSKHTQLTSSLAPPPTTHCFHSTTPPKKY